jgi:tellurite resistance protein TerC
MDVSPLAWAVTILGVAAVFAFDILVIGRRPHTVSMREATVSVLAYVVLAALFGVGVWVVSGQQYGAEFFAGYITELSLSVDDLFFFVVIMSAFAVPREHQLKVL